MFAGVQTNIRAAKKPALAPNIRLPRANIMNKVQEPSPIAASRSAHHSYPKTIRSPPISQPIMGGLE